ncbi:MAG: hypothetical protein ACE5H0_03960 [Bacteroidota bacterium]
MTRRFLFSIALLLPSISAGQQRGTDLGATFRASVGPDSADPPQRNAVSHYFGVGGGMGVSTVSAGDVVDYINTLATPTERIDEFGTAVEFFISPEFQLNASWGLKAEYSYLLKSYIIPAEGATGTYDFTYDVHMPTLVLQYLIIREGYLFKFGAGVGYHFGSFSVGFPPSEIVSAAQGFGGKLEAAGHTSLGGNLYGIIAGDIRLDFVGDLESKNGQKLGSVVSQDNVSLHFFSLGIKFGLSYYF